MTTYTHEALEEFSESAREIVRLFLTEQEQAFGEFARQAARKKYGTAPHISPPDEVVASFARSRYSEILGSV